MATVKRHEWTALLLLITLSIASVLVVSAHPPAVVLLVAVTFVAGAVWGMFLS